MDIVSPIPAIVCLLAAVAVAFLLSKYYGAPPDNGRFLTIDGLRGYLAFFVFLHHSSIWYFYLRTGQWGTLPSNFYTHLGQSSVVLFFMITGFLFFSKLIDAREFGIDWGKFFVSRFLRLVPLYLFAMVLLFFVISYISNGSLNEPLPNILKGALKWLTFTILGAPDLNGIDYTSKIVAGVTWTLPYEWLFYMSLPVLALTVRVTPPFPYLMLGVGTILIAAIRHPQAQHLLLSFGGGIAASLLYRTAGFREFASRKIASVLVLICISLVVSIYPSAYELAPLLLLTLAFALVACGSNLFGILIHPVSRTLGEMAYSIYLLHGIVLFITFNFMIGVPVSKALSSPAHWFVILAITPILILGCALTFRVIERPAMQSATTVTYWLRLKLSKRPKQPMHGAHR